MMEVLVFFDFDGTLIKGNSLPKFFWYCTTTRMVIKKSIYLIPLLFKYVLGTIDSHSAKEQVYKCFFSGIKESEFSEKALSFSLAVIPHLVKEDAIQRLKWHRDNEHTCVLVSASIQDYLIPWAKEMGFTKVLATRLEMDNKGNITGKFMGRNCKGIEKVRRIEEYAGDLGKYEIYAYGDSRGDKEMLEIAAHPFYKRFNRERAFPY